MKLFNHPVIQSIELFSKALSFDCGRCNQRGLYIIVKSGDFMSSAEINTKLSFDDYFSIYLDYINTNQTGNIDYYYCTSNGVQLGMWVKSVLKLKIIRGTLEDNYVKQLRQLPYKCMIKPLFWEEWYNLTFSLISKYKGSEFSIVYDDTYQVGRWLRRQVEHYNRLTPYQKKKISSVYTKKRFSKKNVGSQPTLKNQPSKASDPHFRSWEEQWICYIERIQSLDDKLDKSDVLWLEYRLADYLSLNHVGTKREISWSQSYELYTVMAKLIVDDQIDFIDTTNFSAQDHVFFTKRLIEGKEKSKYRRDFLLNLLDAKYISRDNSLAEQLLECYNDKVDRSVYESSVLSIDETYVNTCENNTLSARQNAELLRIRTYSSNDPYDLF